MNFQIGTKIIPVTDYRFNSLIISSNLLTCSYIHSFSSLCTFFLIFTAVP